MSLPRYPEYKDSGVEWVGTVPAHWNVAPLKRFLDIENGADYKAIEADEGYPVLGSGGRFAFATDYIYDGESVLLGRKGTIDKPLYVSGRFWTVDTMYWSRIRSTACGRYCYYAATTIPFGLYSTNTALPSMTKGALDAHPMAYPPLGEQRAISRFLDREAARIDALIAKQEKLLALLAEKRQATISHAVTRGLDPNVPMKDSGIDWLGEVPAHWETYRLGALFREVNEPGADDLPVLSVSIHSGVSDRELGEDDLDRKVSRSEDRSKYKSVAPGDLTYNMMRAWQGAFGSVAVTGMVSPAYVVGRPKKDFLTSYVEWVLRMPVAASEIRRHSRGITDFRLRLYWEEFKEIKIALPPKREQLEIAEFVRGVSARIDSLQLQAEHNIVLLQERRSALISAAVTGQIDVRGIS